MPGPPLPERQPPDDSRRIIGGRESGDGGPAAATAADLDALRDACTRFLDGHGPGRAADLLATVPPDTQTDRYGEGGAVTELESEVVLLLDKPAVVYLPSGTMAQQAVLRVHADRRQRRVIVFHPACHIDTREGRGYERLHQLTGRPAGEPDRLLTLDDLERWPSQSRRSCSSCRSAIWAASSRAGTTWTRRRLGPGARRGGAPGRRAAVGVRGRLRQAAS